MVKYKYNITFEKRAIDGEQCEWAENCDKDIRFGMLAYGVMVDIKVVQEQK